MGETLDQELVIKVNQAAAELVRRRKECEQYGHKEPSFFPYTITNRSRHSDKVYGNCRYCLASLQRNLTPEEHREIDRFYELLKEPMTF